MRPEDQLLAPEQFPELNREFYTARSGPHDYLRARLRAIYLATSDSETILAAAAEGFQVGTLSAAFTIDDDEAEAERQMRADFLVTESTVLLHHASEALMRLYFAHVGTPACPRLELARFQDFGSFKNRLAKLGNTFNSEQARNELMDVFTGRPEPHEDGPDGLSHDDWEHHCDGLVALLTTVAEFLLRDKNLYNAAKHGIAVRSEELSIALGGDRDGDELTDVALSAEGPALHYLEVSGKKPNTRWQQSTTWVSAESNLGLVHLVTDQIGSLMSVGRARYVRDEARYRFRHVTREWVDAAKGAGRSDSVIQVNTMGMSLVYYERPNNPAKKSKRDRGRRR